MLGNNMLTYTNIFDIAQSVSCLSVAQLVGVKTALSQMDLSIKSVFYSRDKSIRW